MAVPQLSVMRTNVRTHTQDTSTVSPGNTDAQINEDINRAYYWWYENMEKRVAAEVSIVTYNASSLYEVTTGAYPEIYSVTASNRPLERMEWNELKELQAADATASATPTHYALHKSADASGGAPAGKNTWEVALWRIPSGNVNLSAVVRVYPIALSSDTHVPDLGDFEARCVEAIASYWAAMRLDRPDLAQTAINFVPQMIQDKLTAERKRLDPLRRPEEHVA